MESSCKIGVVIIPTSLEDCLVCIGELYSKEIISNIDKLYSLHKDTNALSCVEAWSDGKKTFIDTGDEISWLRSKYMLTRTVQSNCKIPFERQKCSFPVLYDITCGVPLFAPEQVKHTIGIERGTFMFIIWHNMAPNIRKSVINECFNMSNGTQCSYIVYSRLDKKYLRRLGVDRKMIIQLQWIGFSCIMKATVVKKILDVDHEMILALPISVMHRAVTFIREGKRSGMKTDPLRMVCPFDDEDESW
jgi:hypothetical protein